MLCQIISYTVKVEGRTLLRPNRGHDRAWPSVSNFYHWMTSLSLAGMAGNGWCGSVWYQ